MAPRPTDLTEANETYLKSCIANYRATPGGEKEAFRQSCVKHILTTRGIEENIYVSELFHGVRHFYISYLYRYTLQHVKYRKFATGCKTIRRSPSRDGCHSVSTRLSLHSGRSP